MYVRLLSLSLLGSILVLRSGLALALSAVISQGPAPGQTDAATVPQGVHSVEQPGGVAASTGNAAGNATNDTLVIPGRYQTIQDPLAPVNEKSFSVNEKIDQRALHPVANLWTRAVPKPAQDCITHFFDNTEVIPRFANALFQLRFKWAGEELARFGINSTLGLAGFFDPAGTWFGLQEHPDDFGLTLRYYGVPAGPYLMLPFLGPSTVTDTVGRAADAFMNPLTYLTYMTNVSWWVPFSASAGWRLGEAVNYRSLHMDQFEEADRYAVDLYGAVQDFYLQTREHEVKELKQ